MPDRSWMSYKMPFGKYKGDTLEIIRINDPQYLIWGADNINNREVRRECEKAITYLNEVDPWALNKHAKG